MPLNPAGFMPSTHRCKIVLKDVKPPMWRRIELSSDMKLPQVSRALIVAMGWTDTHLHAFRVGRTSYGVPDADFPTDMRSERQVTLADIAPNAGDSFWFDYDFGDGWTHKVTVESIVPSEGESSPRCLAGARACPPEDCGGPYGYRELLNAYADPRHERHREIIEWLPDDFDPDAFDLDETNHALRRVIRRKPRPKAEALGADGGLIFRLSTLYERPIRTMRHVEIRADAALQQLHLTIIAASGYHDRYTLVDRSFAFTMPDGVHTYAKARAPLTELLGDLQTFAYECEPAGIRAVISVTGSFTPSRNDRFPKVYARGNASPDRRLTSAARRGADFVYLQSEPRPESAAFRHGFFSAIVAGPMIMPTAYLSWLMPRANESIESLNAHVSATMAEQNAIADQLLRDPDAYRTEFAGRFDDRDSLADWRDGFAFGMALAGDDWIGAMRADSELEHRFEPIGSLMQIAYDPDQRHWLDDAGLRANLISALPLSVTLLWERWRELFAKPAPTRRERPKTAPNSACPCGSGKKFKRCCGSVLRPVSKP